jgi:CubicO group peptidase (beta-lactamase class C family)
MFFRQGDPVLSADQGEIAMTGSQQADAVVRQAPGARAAKRLLAALVLVAAASTILPAGLGAQQSGSAQGTVARPLLPPDLDSYIAKGMKLYDLPGLAIGVVFDGQLVYAKGFGLRSKTSGGAVDTHTLFQIGSTTKAFLATTLAIMVDRGKLSWNDRVVDLDPEFQLQDPWITREFRVFDLLAQRSGLPSYANDTVGMLGADETAMIRSLRYVTPVTSFRGNFTYTNITHLEADRIVAKADGLPDWDTVLRKELFDPLGMKDSSNTAAAIEAAPNHAQGHFWTPSGTSPIPFTQLFPYNFGGAGDINSNVEDVAQWLRLQLDNGSFGDVRIVSAANLDVTRTPRVAVNDKLLYAMGWIISMTPNGRVVWHNGGTGGFGAFVGFSPEKHVGVVILTNEGNNGLPDSIGMWIFDWILGNQPTDYVAAAFQRAKTKYEASEKVFAKPDHPRSFQPLTGLEGDFSNESFGKASLAKDGDSLVLTLKATGAQLALDPWDGDIFTLRILPKGPYAAVAASDGPLPLGFAQFQTNEEGKLDLLRLTFEDGQAYVFRREAAAEP